MQPETNEATRPSGLPLGARAAIELQLQDAQRDLERLIAEKNGLLSRADVCSALACEPGRHTVRNNSEAASLRLKAFGLGLDIAELRLKVRNLESQLKSAPALPPVVLKRDEVEGMDDMLEAVL